MMPLPVLTDCCEANISAATCLPSTMLPTTRISNDGEPVPSSSDGPPLTMSDQVRVFAGICTIRLQGTAIFVLLIVMLPPQNFASATAAQAVLSVLRVAFWMKPVSSKPWMRAGATEKTGSGRVGMGFAATTPLVGGFAVPPLAYATTAPAANTRRLRSPSIAMRRRRVVRRISMLTACLLAARSMSVGGGALSVLYGCTGGGGRCERRSRAAVITHGLVVR